MSKKNRNNPPARRTKAATPPVAGPGEGIGKKGRMILVSALVLISAGYVLLNKTDPAGGNIYAVLSPLLLVAGYLLVPAALTSKDK